MNSNTEPVDLMAALRTSLDRAKAARQIAREDAPKEDRAMTDTINAAEIWAVPIANPSHNRSLDGDTPTTVGELLVAYFVAWWRDNYDTDEGIDIIAALVVSGHVNGSLDTDGVCSYPGDDTDWEAGRDLVAAVIRSLAPVVRGEFRG